MKHSAKSGRNHPARRLNFEPVYASSDPAVKNYLIRCLLEELRDAKPGSMSDVLAASDRLALRVARRFPHLLPPDQRALLDEPQAVAV